MDNLKLKTKREILNELKKRMFIVNKPESYQTYRANLNFMRGMLWCLNIETNGNENQINSCLKPYLTEEEITKLNNSLSK